MKCVDFINCIMITTKVDEVFGWSLRTETKEGFMSTSSSSLSSSPVKLGILKQKRKDCSNRIYHTTTFNLLIIAWTVYLSIIATAYAEMSARAVKKGKKKFLSKDRAYVFDDVCEAKQITMVVGVDLIEEANDSSGRMGLFLENYVSDDGGSKRLKGMKLRLCLDAWRLFQQEIKKEKKSRRGYVASFPVVKRGALKNMLNQGQKLEKVADWLDDDEFEFWRLSEALEIDYSATSPSLFENVISKMYFQQRSKMSTVSECLKYFI